MKAAESRGTRMTLMAIAVMATVACQAEPAITRLRRAQDLSANLPVQFLKAADASNKALIAESDEAVASFVRDAEAAKQLVTASVESLQPILRDLDYTPEVDLLGTFVSCFEEYRKLDEQILALAGENTNRRAQRLSFGPALKEADAFRNAASLLSPAALRSEWQVRSLAASAVAAVREIQALEAPHIAEAGDLGMTAIEKRMTAAEAEARSALQALAPVVSVASRSQLESVNSTLVRFLTIHAQITELSRRNTNVRSLALSLNDRGRIAGAAEGTLRALRDALAERGSAATR